tara:strand:- start:100 stop:231 length:132 start_codon:yes stop_codon:yes gene_type:complete
MKGVNEDEALSGESGDERPDGRESGEQQTGRRQKNIPADTGWR